MIIKVPQIVFSNLIVAIICCSIGSCQSASSYIVTVRKDALVLDESNGVHSYNSQPFTGIASTYFASGKVQENINFVDGIKHGPRQSWFNNGTLSFETSYVKGRQHGITRSWWNNGKLRSESNYEMGSVHGEQKQWYYEGNLYKKRNLNMGKEKGLQQAWRKNGALYTNYEAKNGRIFGLKRSNLCYELEEEVVQYND